jgi:hypothetical protein
VIYGGHFTVIYNEENVSPVSYEYASWVLSAAINAWNVLTPYFGNPPDDNIVIRIRPTLGKGARAQTLDVNPDGTYDPTWVWAPGDNIEIWIDPTAEDNMKLQSWVNDVIAHEFMHAIQAAYDWHTDIQVRWCEEWAGGGQEDPYRVAGPASDAWIDEGTAVWAEDFVYDNLNYYLRHINSKGSFLSLPNTPIYQHDSRGDVWPYIYETVLYWKFLSEHYGGFDVIRRVLEQTRNMLGGIYAVDGALKTISPYNSFERSFKEWITANWVNGLHNHNGNLQDDAYEEGDNYDDATAQIKTTFTGAENSLSGNVGKWATNYVEIAPSSSGPLKIVFDGDQFANFSGVRAILVKGSNVYGMNDLNLVENQDDNYFIYSANGYDNVILVVGGGLGGSYTLRLQNQYGYLSPPFKFSDVIDNGDSSWVSPYHVQLRISTNPSLDQPEGEGGALGEGNSGWISSPVEESSPQVQTTEENWVEVGRGRDYLTYQNQATGEYKQVIYPGPIHTWDGERWVSYVFENMGDYYQVQHPIASARFYPDHTEFWDENFSEVGIEDERWAIERWQSFSWQDTGLSDATISYEVIDEDNFRLVRTCQTNVGTLRQTYSFTKGSPVKIKVEFVASQDAKMRFVWRPSGIAATKEVKGRIQKSPPKFDTMGMLIENARMADAWVSYLDDENRPKVCLAWIDEVKAVNDISLLLEPHVRGRRAALTFGEWDLLAGETAALDPTVTINPSFDGYVYCQPGTEYWWVDTGSSIMCTGSFDSPPIYWFRAFLRFDISSLWGKDITSAALKIYLSGVWANKRESNCILHHITDIGNDLSYWDDWDRGINRDFGIFAYADDPPAWKNKDVKSSVVDEVGAGSTYMSFRLRGSEEDTDSDWNYWEFNTMESSNKPYLEVTYTTPNSPPNTPSTPSGPTSGYVNTSYTYSTSATDPEGDQVRYRFDWGNGVISDWTGWVSSGSSASKSYSWSSSGTYQVKAQAQDSKYENSGWSSPLTVTISKRSTALTVSPSSFQVRSGENFTFTATLTSGGSPLSGKIITWSDNAGGTFNPSSGTTNSSGQVSTIYTAPKVNYSQIAARVTATFGGDAQYSSSSGNSTGIILPPNVKSAWVYWRFDNSRIDDANYDNRMQMAGPENVTGIWSFDIPPRFGSNRIGSTIYWRVKARASDGRENWSPVYVGGRLTNPPSPVEVSISPDYQSGTPGTILTYVVTVKNNDIDPDNFGLEVSDGAGWSVSISPNSLMIPPGENRAATLSVTIPENAEYCTDDVITITATSRADPTVSDNVSCIARVCSTPCSGTASIRLAASGAGISPPFLWGIRKVKVTTSLVVYYGDNLRLRFLDYDNMTVESETVIWSRTHGGAENVTLTNLVVPHDNHLPYPSDYVKRVKLVLTDSAGNLILDNMAWYKVVQDYWGGRLQWIILKWSSHTPAQQDQLGAEIQQIILNWSNIPSGRDQHDFSQA